MWLTPLRQSEGSVLHSSLFTDTLLFVSLAVKGVMMFVWMVNAPAQLSLPATHP